jgi:hypothetical protein
MRQTGLASASECTCVQITNLKRPDMDGLTLLSKNLKTNQYAYLFSGR